MSGCLKSETFLCVVLGASLMLVGVISGAQESNASDVNPAPISHAPRSYTPPPVAIQAKQEALPVADRAETGPIPVAEPVPVARVFVREERMPVVKSSAAIVVEQMGDGALFQKNADAVVPIASITKLMTAMVALDGLTDLKTRISVSKDDIDYLRGSRSRLKVGASLTLESALLIALMSSENRAAHALARHYPGGVPAFLKAMNDKAHSLGMRNTRFEDPSGLSGNNVSTARDLAKLVTAAYRYPLIREFSTMPSARVEISRRLLDFYNTNPLVKNVSWNVGLSKTGYIQEAGKCLVMQARVADVPVVIVLLDSTGKQARVRDANRIKRWMEAAHAAPGQRAAVESHG
jgi:D-alanyl-D-alanine endopeptidase (penicillin-binding protein 7)